jgi:TPR repeat protein
MNVLETRIVRVCATALILAMAALAFIAPESAFAQAASEEANRVASAVSKRTAWISELGECPAKLMPPIEASDQMRAKECRLGNFEACLAKCASGSPGACYWLANGLERQNALPEAVNALFQRSCRLGVVSGCTNRAASLLDEADAGNTDAKACAVATFKLACERDDPWGCTMFASHLVRRDGVERNDALARQVLKKSCRFGIKDQACVAANAILQNMEDGGVEPDSSGGKSSPMQ